MGQHVPVTWWGLCFLCTICIACLSQVDVVLHRWVKVGCWRAGRLVSALLHLCTILAGNALEWHCVFRASCDVVLIGNWVCDQDDQALHCLILLLGAPESV
jgi:hypothetical protein